MAPRLMLLMSSGSKKKEPRYTCLSEAKASHPQRMWAEILSSAPHLLHNGLSDSPIRWKCLLRVLCPVRKPLTALDCILLKDRNLALTPRQGPKTNSQVCLWVTPRPRHHTQCWLSNQHLILLLISCQQTPKASSSPTNFRTEPPLVRLSVISLPHTPPCPGNQNSPTACRAEICSMSLALSDQYRHCSDGLKSFPTRLTPSSYWHFREIYSHHLHKLKFHKLTSSWAPE